MSAHLDCKTNKKSLYFQIILMKSTLLIYICYLHLKKLLITNVNNTKLG